MPLTRFVADVLGVVTICLVALLVLLGLLCVLFSFYLRTRIHSQDFVQLGFFSGPWIIRITFILFAIWWGFGEIVRLTLLRHEGRVLNALNLKWQETVCKCYIVSNLGFAEPCMFLVLVFLLRATLQTTDSGTLSQRWNRKTAFYVLLYCFPVFILQLVVILIGPQLHLHRLPHYFTSTAAASRMEGGEDFALCTYPLLSTIFLGVFATVVTAYLFWLGRQILHLVINKGLQKRVYALILSVSGFLPFRVLFLGLSVLSKPEHVLFEALAFMAFLSLLCCVGVGICMLVYCPVADSLALNRLQNALARRRISEENDDTISLIANQTSLEENFDAAVPVRNDAAFTTMEEDEEGSEGFVELSLFSPSPHSTPLGSPRFFGWPMHPPQVHEP